MHGGQGDLGGGAGDSWGDTGEDEPAGVVEDLGPWIGTGGGFGAGRVEPVVDDLGGPLVDAGFDEEEAETTVWGAHDVTGFDAMGAQGGDGGVGERVVGR